MRGPFTWQHPCLRFFGHMVSIDQPYHNTKDTIEFIQGSHISTMVLPERFRWNSKLQDGYRGLQKRIQKSEIRLNSNE